MGESFNRTSKSTLYNLHIWLISVQRLLYTVKTLLITVNIRLPLVCHQGNDVYAVYAVCDVYAVYDVYDVYAVFYVCAVY